MEANQYPGTEAIRWVGYICGAATGIFGVWKAVRIIPRRWRVWRKRVADEKAGWAKMFAVVDALAPAGGPSILSRFSGIESRLDQVAQQHATIVTQLQRIIGIQDLSLEHQDQAIMIANPSGAVTKVTPLLVKWVGKSTEVLLTHGWRSFIAFTDKGRVLGEYNGAIADCRPLDICFDVVAENGQPAFPVRMVMQPIDPASVNGFFIRVFRTDTDTEHRDVLEKLRGSVSKLSNEVHSTRGQIEQRVQRLEELELLRETRMEHLEQSIKRT